MDHRLIVNSGGAATPLHAHSYLASLFDVAHDRGLTTALLAAKSKFGVFDWNYDAHRGAMGQESWPGPNFTN